MCQKFCATLQHAPANNLLTDWLEASFIPRCHIAGVTVYK